MLIRIARMEMRKSADGSVGRFSVDAQGCPHGCADCNAPQVSAFSGGTEVDVDEVWEQIEQSEGIGGIVLGGGEPFCQSGALAELARRAKEKGLSVHMYTGYTFLELAQQGAGGGVGELLSLTDVMIDGPCTSRLQVSAEENRLGSAAARLIDVQESLKKGEPVYIEEIEQ